MKQLHSIKAPAPLTAAPVGEGPWLSFANIAASLDRLNALEALSRDMRPGIIPRVNLRVIQTIEAIQQARGKTDRWGERT